MDQVKTSPPIASPSPGLRKKTTRLTRLLPTGVYLNLRYAALAALDGIDKISGTRDPLIPPRRLMLDGPPSVELFRKNGRDFLNYYVSLCGLQPGASILDVGSGMGRKTIPLTQYLDSTGRYEGVDIFRAGIEWCRGNITPRHPNFQFSLLDVYNKYYNPGGRHKASEFRFPYESSTFDFEVLTSVFTHMLPADVDHYLGEIGRTMKAGAKCFISYFLLNGESSALIAGGRSGVAFPHRWGRHKVEKLETPEDAICFDESWVRESYARQGLEIQEPIQYGSWSGRDTFLDYQDIVIAVKRG